MDRKKCREEAKKYKEQYLNGEIDLETAKELIQPCLNIINQDMRKIYKAYGVWFFNEITFENYIKTVDKS